MRNPIHPFFALLLLAAPCLSQDLKLPLDPRPFGKYLAGICTLSGEMRTLRCPPTPLPGAPEPDPKQDPADPKLLDQTITVKLVCDPGAKGSCTSPAYPLEAGAEFFVEAKADSGLPVQQNVLSGVVTPSGGSGTVAYRATGPGFITIRATASGNTRFSAAAPVDLI